MTKKIAIIGAGVSGMTAAHLLNPLYDIRLYEANNRLGGHTATVDVTMDNQHYAIDTGFIVYNDWTYPNFIKLMDQLKVKSQDTTMGFSVSCQKSGLEYAGNNLNTLFAQRRNIVSARFLGMLKDIIRFNHRARADLLAGRLDTELTLGAYLERNRFSQSFAHDYLKPMGAAIWSSSPDAMVDFPAHFFVHFFYHHGLLNIVKRPQWRVISGGSKAYIEPLTAAYKDKIILNARIKKVVREANGVALINDNAEVEYFDQVIFATHSDQALALLDAPSASERSILGAMPYSENSVILHHDESLLPANRRTWSSWNYRLDARTDIPPLVTYDMNILQNIQSKRTFCVSLNADHIVAPEKIIDRFCYAHPQFSLSSLQAQGRWSEINGVNNTWFCGAYWANGFHEDGVTSALRVAEHFGASL